MKILKSLFLLLFFILILPLSIHANEIDITNMEVLEKKDYVSEKNQPSINENIIDLNLRFEDFEQYIIYKIRLANNTSHNYNYELKINESNIIYELVDDDGLIESKSSKDVLLKVNYKNEINENLYNNGIYNIEDKIQLLLSSDYDNNIVGQVKGVIEDLKENPKTGRLFNYTLVVVLIIGGTIIYIRLKKKSSIKYFLLLIMIIPIVVYAAGNRIITIDINVNAEINKPTIAIFDIGENINERIKAYSDNVKYFLRSTVKTDNAVEVQSNNSPNKIYMYYDSYAETVYFYSNAVRVCYNANSSSFYSQLVQLLDFDRNIKPNYIVNAQYMFNWTLHYVEDYELDLRDWNTSSLINAYDMFHGMGYYANNFKLNISGWDTSNVTNADNLFYSIGYNMHGKLEIYADDLDLHNTTIRNRLVDHIGEYADEAIVSMDNLILPSTTITTNIINGIAQSGKRVTFSAKNWDVSKVTSKPIDYIAGYAKEKLEMDLTGWKISDDTYIDQLFIDNSLYAADQKINLTNWDLTEATSLHRLFSYAGLYSTNLEIDLTGWDTSTITDMSDMFHLIDNCSPGENPNAKRTVNIIGIEDLNTSNVTNMQNMFRYAFNYAEDYKLDLTKWDVSKVTNMNSAFAMIFEYSDGIEFDVTGWDTSNVEDADSAFAYVASYSTNYTLKGVKELTFPKYTPGEYNQPFSGTIFND